MMTLTKEQREILHHTLHRAAGGRYCGGGPEMDALVSAGLMIYLGTPGWASDPFYGITLEGRAALHAWDAAQPKPPPPPKLSRAQKRYASYCHSGDDMPFGEWLKRKLYLPA